ncbi:MAG: hypothetical protein KM310_08935 [Clostridiales bacterium]|nr:hypothetical protein [Clostridiales bacterium]
MRRAIPFLATVLVALLVGLPPASAHITGVFLYFLKDVAGETASSSQSILEGQIREVDRRLAELTPLIEAKEKAYREREARLGEAVRAYERYSGAMVAALLRDAQNPVDILAGLRMFQKTLGKDVEELDALGRELQELRARKAELESFRSMLLMFDEARKRHLAYLQVGDEKIQESLYLLSEEWESQRVGPMRKWTEKAARVLTRWRDIWQPAPDGRGYIDEEGLNELLQQALPIEGLKDVRVHLRADHVFIEAHLLSDPALKEFVPHGYDDRQFIAFGQMNRISPSEIQLYMEFLMIDGYVIDLEDPDFQRDRATWQVLKIQGSKGQRLFFEQDNGRLWLWEEPRKE